MSIQHSNDAHFSPENDSFITSSGVYNCSSPQSIAPQYHTLSGRRHQSTRFSWKKVAVRKRKSQCREEIYIKDRRLNLQQAENNFKATDQTLARNLDVSLRSSQYKWNTCALVWQVTKFDFGVYIPVIYGRNHVDVTMSWCYQPDHKWNCWMA